LITGVADGGLGGEAAVTIASASPALLILSARATARAAPIAEKIASLYPAVKTRILAMDLGSLASVREAAKEVIGWSDVVIDVVINNAAVMACPYSTTIDGFESQFAIDHLGHFLFTNLLLKAEKIRDGGRIVNVSSNGYEFSGIRFDDPGFSVSLLRNVMPLCYLLTSLRSFRAAKRTKSGMRMVRPRLPDCCIASSSRDASPRSEY
jgi:NAD(P)-dependent dehydrogenase (short-subunit alcohol dehydrogenase family)